MFDAKDVLDAIQSPLMIGPINENRTKKYIGARATVVVNVDTGRITTGYKTSPCMVRRLTRSSAADVKIPGAEATAINWTPAQLQLLREMTLPFDPALPMAEDQVIDLQDMACDEIEIDPNVPDYIGTPTERGAVAESIADILGVALDR